MTSRKVVVTVRWTARKNEVAHATLPKMAKTLCGQETTAEQYGWPAIARCGGCQSTLDTMEGTVR